MKVLKRIVTLCLLFILLGLGALYYALKIEPYMLVVKGYDLGKKDGEQIRVIQISDIQVSEEYNEKELKKLVKKINELKPEVLLFTGDLYENYGQYGPESMVIEQLSDMEATYGKYAIWGNRDYGGGGKRRYAQILKAAGFQLLENEATTIVTERGKKIYLGGLDDALLGKQDISQIRERDSSQYDYEILMTHEPDMADEYAEEGFSLILGGHSHGGQVRIPFVELYHTSLAEKYIRGFYSIGSRQQTKLYVNQGIGTSHYTIRFGVPPEITVLDIGL